MKIELVGVVGAGVMGSGLAQNIAQAEYQVILLDITEEVLQNAKQVIRSGLRFQSFFGQGQPRESENNIMQRIVFSTDYELLRETDFIIESVPEKWETKRHVYEKLDEVCPRHSVFGSNTSAISITRIGSITRKPEKVIGMHFMNPVPMKSTVEIIKGYHTSEETVETAMDLLENMGKHWVIVNDAPGFVSNRVLMLMINEAIFLVQEQVATIEDIDRIFKSCFGHKMGPLETGDLIGLDTILYSLEVLYESFRDTKFRPCPLLRKMVDAGLCGQKTGQGFYSYVHTQREARE